MLADWYFCACIGAGPATAHAVLSILATFDGEDRDERLVALAYEELSRTDARTHIYALPQVLSSLTRCGPLHRPVHTQRYFDQLVAAALEDDREMVRAVLNGVSPGAMVGDLAVLTRAATGVLGLADRPLTTVPYMDLVDYLTEVVVVSVIAVELRDPKGPHARLVDQLDREGNPLRVILQQALQNRYGRLPCRLAAQVGCRVSVGKSSQRIQADLCRAGVAPLEPDLLDAIVDALACAQMELSPDDRALRLLDETRLRRAFSAIGRDSQVTPENEKVLRTRVGIQKGEPGVDLSTVYWRVLRWQHAAAVAPDTTARRLASEWRPRAFEPPARRGPGQARPPKRPTAIEEGIDLALANPWLTPAATFPYYWHTARRGEVMVNLLGAALVASKVLAATTLPDARNSMLLFVAHVSDVLHDTYRDWLAFQAKEGGRRDPPRQIPPRFTGLTLFAREAINRIGHGHVEAVDPGSFVDILNGCAAGRTQIPRAEHRFTTRILPRVMVGWVHDAYLSAIHGSASYRWLAHVGSVCSFYAQSGDDRDFDRKLRAAALARFVAEDQTLLADEALDWQLARDPKGQPMHWRVHPRLVLLTDQRLPPEAWREKEGWAEPEPTSSVYLVRALERLAVFFRLSPEARAVDPSLESWSTEWLPALRRIGHEREIDRFIRLRLLELFDGPLLDASQQEQIASVIFEFGSAYDLAELFRRAFPLGPDGQPAPVDPTRAAVQHRIVRAAVRAIERYERGVAVRATQGPRSPHKAFFDRTQIDVLSAALTQLSYWQTAGGQPREIAATLRSLWSAALKLQADSRILASRMGISSDWSSLTGPHTSFPWFHESIIVDRNQLVATVFSDRLALQTGDFNGFSASEDEWRALSDGSRTTVTALAFVTQTGQFGDGSREYAFNWGGQTCLRARRAPIRDMREGEVLPVRIKLRQDERREWILDERAAIAIERVRPLFRAGDVDEISVADFARRQLEQDVWDADLSRHFAGVVETRAHSRFAILRPDGRWYPVDHGLAWLLLDGVKFGRVAVLTLLKEIEESAGLDGWRFSTAPGENFVLRRSDFTPESLEELDAEVEDRGGGCGLLVAVTPTLVDGFVRLALARHADDEALDRRYRSLRLPFDHRNIEWTRLFRHGDPETAHKTNGDWVVTLPDPDQVPGFPYSIPVQFRHRPAPGTENVQFTVTYWDPTRGIVTGDLLATSQVSPAGGDWTAFLARWIDPQPGERLEITRVTGDLDRMEGLLPCVTSENVRILVEAESLTMQPIERSLFLSEPRRAEIIECQIEARGADKELEIEVDAALLQILKGNACSGILKSVPRRPFEEALCDVVWQEDHPEPVQIKIRNLNRPEWRWICQGTTIDGTFDGSLWHFFPRRVRAVARAWWSVDDEGLLPGQSATYLDTTRYRDRDRPLLEVAPGKLVVMNGTAPPGARHLGILRGHTFEGGLPPGERASSNIRREIVWGRAGNEHQRSVLRLRSGTVAALCRNGAPYGPVEIAGIQVRSEERGNGMVVLRREVELRRQRSTIQAPTSTVQAGPTPEEVWAHYLALSDRELEVVVERRSGEFFVGLPEIEIDERTGSHQLQVPCIGERTKWTARVQVALDHGPLLPHIDYDVNGVASLIEMADGQWLASFRVRPWTTAKLRTKLGARDGEQESLGTRKLIFVGIADAAAAEPEYLFEYGYGCVVQVPLRKLRWDGGDFRSKAEVLLYEGDRVTVVTFFEDNTDLNGGEPLPIVSINGMELLSEARTLYQQRHDHHIVHLLKIESIRGRLRVTSIEGFEERTLDDDARSFRAVTAALAPDSRRHIESRFEGRTQGTALAVMGRLDEEAFRKTRGRTLQFHHVRMSFEPSTEGEPLKPGERIFLQAGQIITQRNETMLVVRQPDALFPDDVGPEVAGAQGARILRRNFSVRQELLRRIYDDPQLGPDRLVGRLLMARVAPRTARRRREGDRERRLLHVSLIDQPPRRQLGALASALQRGSVLVAIAEQDAAGEVVAEIRPTVYVGLPHETISTTLDPIERGAIMRIEKAPTTGREFKLSLAAFSDSRYAPARTRPAVALPKNDMFAPRESDNPNSDAFWTRERFSIGDLPGLLPVAWGFDRDAQTWTSPQPPDLIGLMRTPHPKLVTLGTDATGIVRLAPSITEPCGWLNRDPEGLGVTFCSLTDSGAERQQPLAWRTLTFGDEGVADVRARVEKYKWRFHDQFTVTWLPGERIEEAPTGEHSGWTGPLFFERRASGLSLRYSQVQLPRYGGSVDLLLDFLRSCNDVPATLPVAAVADGGIGLWIEIAPGRVVELPGSIVAEASTRTVVTHFNWRAFSAGDRVTLKLARGDTYGIDTVTLIDWRPGPRRAFGAHRALLPITAFDRERGALSIGSGDWSMTLPIESVRAEDRVAVVTLSDVQFLSDSQLTRRLLRKGDVVLLSHDEEQRPSVAGWTELNPKPHRRDGAAEGPDVLGTELVTRRGGRLAFGGPRFAALVDAMGGSVPVTIEGFDRDATTIYVSTRELQSLGTVPAGTMTCGRVVALLGDRRTLLLRVGGGLLPLPVSLVVSGLPPAAFDDAIEALRRSRTVVWVRADSTGRLRTGICDQARQEFRVSGETAVVGERLAEPGVIVRSTDSLALYWLPLARAAWMLVPRARAEALLVKRHLPNVTLTDSSDRLAVSVIDTEDAKRQFRKLVIGEELTVAVVERVAVNEGEHARYIVESFPASLLLELEVRAGGAFAKGDEIAAEIDERTVDQEPWLLAVPVGQRRRSLDLASWMVMAGAADASRVEQQQYLAWRNEGPLALPSGAASQLSDEHLHRALCLAYDRKGEVGRDPVSQADIAEVWITRHLSASEVHLPFALMALLVLDRSAWTLERGNDRNANHLDELRTRWREGAFEVTRELGRRALRSAHLEVLSTRWLGNPARRDRRDGLWERLNILAGVLRGQHTDETLKAVRQFCEAVDLRESDEHRAIADALSASLGDLDRLHYLRPASEICRTLIALARMVPPKPLTGQGLLEPQRAGFRSLLDRVTIGNLDIVMLRGFRV